jgi:hypothetical protein
MDDGAGDDAISESFRPIHRRERNDAGAPSHLSDCKVLVELMGVFDQGLMTASACYRQPTPASRSDYDVGTPGTSMFILRQAASEKQ